MNLFEQASKITEAYCIERNIRASGSTRMTSSRMHSTGTSGQPDLYGQPAPAEACTDVK